jgi:hypothetical protein
LDISQDLAGYKTWAIGDYAANRMSLSVPSFSKIDKGWMDRKILVTCPLTYADRSIREKRHG